ncbi:hypothetical protein Rt10032_c18g6092 [Rhodotorula toruloides]|uniref:Uncharacterized protein n=1 Tax=Rhodotorula toruloides TaxID=5286 RepID=A0A511KQ73_RHOTO|nr:hypothetical protein Rt10032_c18g6092 [Rhodotorula toruloides]
MRRNDLTDAPLRDENARTTPKLSSSNDSGFEDEVVLVPTSPLASSKGQLTTPAAFRPFSSPTLAQNDDANAHKPVEGVFATHRHWTNGGKASGIGLSEKARGKLPAPLDDNAATADRRRKSLDAVARGKTVFDGVEIEVPARRKSRLHMRWHSGDSEADVSLEQFVSSSSDSSPTAHGAGSPPLLVEDSTSSSSGETVIAPKRYSLSTKPRDESTIRGRAEQIPSPSLSTSLPEGERSPSTSATASSSRTKHSFELIIDQPSRRRAPPQPSRTPLRFPDKPASHPLNLLRIRSHPLNSAPPPQIAARFVRNPHFAPAEELGWIEGRGPHVEVKKRLGQVEWAAAAATVKLSREPSPLVSTEGTPAPAGGRRSARVPVQARPPSMIYPSAIDRLASSTKRSRSPSSQLPTPPPSTSLPLLLPRRPPLSTVLRKRYDWLQPRSRGPFKIDGSALGTDPTLLGFEWDEDELDEERWANGEAWEEEEEEDDGEIRTGQYGGPFRVAQAAEAARRALLSPPASSSSQASLSPVMATLEFKPWTVVPWAWKDLDAAKGRAGPGGTAGWATRDPWMHYLLDSSGSDDATSSSVAGTLSSPVAHHSPRKKLAEAGSGAQVGAKITAVPPSTSSPTAVQTVESTTSEVGVSAISPTRHENPEPTNTLTSPTVIDSTTASSASSSRSLSPVVVVTTVQLLGSNRRRFFVPTGVSFEEHHIDIARHSRAPLPSASSGLTPIPSATGSPASPPGPSKPSKRLPKRRIPSTTASSTSASAAASASASTSSVSPPPRKVQSTALPAAKKRKLDDQFAAKLKKARTPPLVPKQANLKRPSSSPERSAAPLKRRKKEPTPEGFARCTHPGCPSPFYQPKAASSAGNHAQNYHGSTTIISWRNSDRSVQLTRSKKTGAFECDYCGFWSMNAASTKQHTYVRKGRVCPGPPHAAR